MTEENIKKTRELYQEIDIVESEDWIQENNPEIEDKTKLIHHYSKLIVEFVRGVNLALHYEKIPLKIKVELYENEEDLKLLSKPNLRLLKNIICGTKGMGIKDFKLT